MSLLHRVYSRVHLIGIATRTTPFNDLYEAYYRSILRYALVARGPDEADDIVAETFQKAYLAWAGHGDRPRSPLAWLLTIASIETDRNPSNPVASQPWV